jgi:transposase-like protein
MPEQITTYRCPRCGSYDTRKSIRRGIFDSFVRMFDYQPFRCRSCQNRFQRKTGKSPEDERAAREAKAEARLNDEA